MVLLELAGGPGAGKSTLAAYLFYKLKKAGFRVELVGEAAREIIYNGNPGQTPKQLLDNQLLLAGLQYERILRLKRHDIQVAITDSPVAQGLMYCKGHVYAYGLRDAIESVTPEFQVLNIFVNPKPGSYDPESRVQRTEKEARALDAEVRELLRPFWAETKWNQEDKLATKIIRKLKSLGVKPHGK